MVNRRGVIDVIGGVEKALVGRPLQELVLAVDHELLGHPADDPVDEGFGRLDEHSIRLAVVAYLAVREAS